MEDRFTKLLLSGRRYHGEGMVAAVNYLYVFPLTMRLTAMTATQNSSASFRWLTPLRDAVRDAGGLVLGHRSLTPEELIAFGMDVGDEIELEAEADTTE